MMISPVDDFVYLVNNVLLGEQPTIEDFILLVGTLVAFIAFVLWCCFPIMPKDAMPQHYEGKEHQHKYGHRRKIENHYT